MSKRIIRVLHIEDDSFQHRLLAHLLRDLDEFEFKITCAESELEGLEIFDRAGADLVVLDYRLPQGDGLHCLKELRRPRCQDSRHCHLGHGFGQDRPRARRMWSRRLFKQG